MGEEFVKTQECDLKYGEVKRMIDHLTVKVDDIMKYDNEQDKERAKLWGAVREMQADIKHLLRQQSWFMGVISSVLGGLILWLITKG